MKSQVRRPTAQAVTRWLHAATARVRSQVRSCGICGGRATGVDHLRVNQLPSPNLHSTSCFVLIIIIIITSSEAGTIGPLMVGLLSEFTITQPRYTRNGGKYLWFSRPVTVKSTVFRVLTPCSSKIGWHFGGTNRLSLQHEKVCKARN
jgi:hypothetical protein